MRPHVAVDVGRLCSFNSGLFTEHRLAEVLEAISLVLDEDIQQ